MYKLYGTDCISATLLNYSFPSRLLLSLNTACKVIKMIPIAVLMERVVLLDPALRPAVIAALNELTRRGLTATTLNWLREAMIAAGYSSYVKYLGEIAEKLF